MITPEDGLLASREHGPNLEIKLDSRRPTPERIDPTAKEQSGNSVYRIVDFTSEIQVNCCNAFLTLVFGHNHCWR